MDWIIVWFSISEKSESKQYCWCKDCRCTFCLLVFFFKSFILHEGKLTPQTIAGFQGNSEQAIFLTCTITANTYVFFNILACSHECPPVWENSGKSTGVYRVSPCSCSSSQFSTFILSLTSSVSPADVHSSQVALVSSFPYVFSSILSVLPISKGIISSLSCRERGELHLQLLNHPGDRADLIIKTRDCTIKNNRLPGSN